MTTILCLVGLFLVWVGVCHGFEPQGPEFAKAGVWLVALSYAAYWLMYGRPYVVPPGQLTPFLKAAAYLSGLYH